MQLFNAILESALNFEHFEKNEPHSLRISEIDHIGLVIVRTQRNASWDCFGDNKRLGSLSAVT